MDPLLKKHEKDYMAALSKFVDKAERIKNPYFGKVNNICNYAYPLKFANACLYFDIRPFYAIGKILPLFYFVTKCGCHGHIMYCRNCGLFTTDPSVSSYFHTCKCYGFEVEKNIVQTNNSGSYTSIRIGESDREHGFHIAITHLLNTIPHLFALRMNYDIIGKCDVNIESIESARRVANSKTYTFAEKVYIILNDSPEYQPIIDKLTESPPQCIVCGKYYDHFPTIDNVIFHLFKCQ